MNTLVVPTIRENCINDFLMKWRREPFSEIIVVEDNPERTFTIGTEQHYSWKEIDELLGDSSWIISRRDSAIRSFGFYMAWKRGATTIFTLDDDCYPLDTYPAPTWRGGRGRGAGSDQFISMHFNRIYDNTKWTELVPGMRTRGLPYRNQGRIKNVVANVGLWTNVPDLDGAQSLLHPLERWEPPANVDRIMPIGQYFPWCLTPEQPILLANGLEKPITEIKNGDMVITNQNESHEVLQVLSREIDEEIVNVIVSGTSTPLRLTFNHEILTHRGFTRAENLTLADYVLFPLARHKTNVLSDEEMYCLGLFLAEGSYCKHPGMADSKKLSGIRIYLHSREEPTFGAKFKAFMKHKFNKCGTKYLDGNSLTLEFSGKDLAAWFYSFCGEYCYEKQIAPHLLRTKNLDMLIRGFFDGDGHCGTNRNRPYCTAKTTSKNLAKQIQYALNSLGYYCKITTSKATLLERASYQISMYGVNAERFILQVMGRSPKYHSKNKSHIKNYRLFDDHIGFKIHKLRREKYKGKVYNLTISDNHTYVANNCIVKNCGMNFAFVRDVAVMCYFPLMGQDSPYGRFDDIWFGVIFKKIADHLGLLVSVGHPFVYHARASNPFNNLIKEAPGIKANEDFWELVDGIKLSGRTPADCMGEVGDHLNGHTDSYWSKLGKAILTWTGLFRQ